MAIDHARDGEVMLAYAMNRAQLPFHAVERELNTPSPSPMTGKPRSNRHRS
jgi:hypothetical protein